METVLEDTFRWHTLGVLVENVFGDLPNRRLICCTLELEEHASGIHVFCGYVKDETGLERATCCLLHAVGTESVTGKSVDWVCRNGV